MKTAIGYSYLNGEKEHPRALDPWYPHVDHIIALDGRYKTPLPPNLRAKYKDSYSTDNSEHLLKTRYGDKVVYEKLHDTQMKKRQRYLDIAGELKVDYLIVWDTDDYVHPDYQMEWGFFERQLERELKYPENRLYYMWAWIPDETLWPKQHNEIESNIWRQYTRIHKNPGTMRYSLTHWTFADKTAKDIDANLWRWKNRDKSQFEDNPYMIHPSTNTIDGIRIATDRTLRAASELEFGNSWTFQQIHYEGFKYNLEPYLKLKGVKCIGMDLPMEKYYFKPAGTLNGEGVGQIVLLNEDGTETLTHQEFHIDPSEDEQIRNMELPPPCII